MGGWLGEENWMMCSMFWKKNMGEGTVFMREDAPETKLFIW